MFPLLTERHSGYLFESEKIVTQEQLKMIIEAGHLAPSCYNDQPWYFIVCDKNTNPKAYETALSTLVEFNQNWAKATPILIISVAASKFSRNDKPNRWGQFDTGAAAFSMMLQATAMGLMAHQMGGFDEVKVQQLFSIPEGFVPMSVMAIGYPSSNEPPKARERNSVDSQFFMGSWGKKTETK